MSLAAASPAIWRVSLPASVCPIGALDVTAFLVPRPASPSGDKHFRIPAGAKCSFLPLPAEILVIDPDPGSVALGLMS